MLMHRDTYIDKTLLHEFRGVLQTNTISISQFWELAKPYIPLRRADLFQLPSLANTGRDGNLFQICSLFFIMSPKQLPVFWATNLYSLPQIRTATQQIKTTTATS